ncbi:MULTISPECIES: hypothetical protein [Alcaligenaceae]|jgi:hypothetical protein|nr:MULTISPECIES: hypothetical protein [Alcaligenaceae]UTM02335.1 hypothetical protein MID00_02655 [Alcaligenes sp. NLF5-7]
MAQPSHLECLSVFALPDGHGASADFAVQTVPIVGFWKLPTDMALLY